jgi:hypothetical protein
MAFSIGYSLYAGAQKPAPHFIEKEPSSFVCACVDLFSVANPRILFQSAFSAIIRARKGQFPDGNITWRVTGARIGGAPTPSDRPKQGFKA